MVCTINLRFRRFGSGTGQIIGLIVYYIALRPKDARRASSDSRPQDLVKSGHQKGPRPVFYKINLRFRRFGCGTGQIIGLSAYYIGFIDRNLHGGSATPRAHNLAFSGELLGPATISPCTITMDLDAIICFMIDRLMRAPDKDVHVPSVGSKKYPSYNVDGIYS